MKILVKYVRLHNDNYQGGSGKLIESSCIVALDNKNVTDVIMSCIHTHLEHNLEHPAFKTTESYPRIISMELFK